jgi:hypothetical protein
MLNKHPWRALGIKRSEWKRRNKKRKKELKALETLENSFSEPVRYSKEQMEREINEEEYGGGLEDEIDEDSHCDMVTENY